MFINDGKVTPVPQAMQRSKPMARTYISVRSEVWVGGRIYEIVSELLARGECRNGESDIYNNDVKPQNAHTTSEPAAL